MATEVTDDTPQVTLDALEEYIAKYSNWGR